jgi:hypothetical protein
MMIKRTGSGSGVRVVVVMVLIIISCLGVVMHISADPYVGGLPLETVNEGTVSGGVFIDAYPGFDTVAEKSFLLPEYQKVRWARLYVAVYCGHMENNYPGIATVEFNGGNGWQTLGTETLDVPYTFPGKGGTGPVMVNSHCSRVSSDYLIWYDVPASISSRTVSARVRTEKLGGTGSFDGRVKTITLVVAYDDQDRDRVLYWIAQGHDTDSYRTEQELGESYNGEFSIDTSSVDEDWAKADLKIAYLASRDAGYTFNNDVLEPSSPTGAYFGINSWEVTGILEPGQESEVTYDNQPNEYYKIFLAALTVRYPEPDTGSLAVFTSPAGATIFVDGMEQEERSNTTIMSLSEGSHQIEVEKEGFQKPAEMNVQIRKGETAQVSFVLTAQSGSVRISSEPPGATVLLDGALQQCTTPCTLPAVPTGEHQVIVRKSGYGDETREVVVEEGESIDISADLVPLSGGSSGTTTDSEGSTTTSRAEGYAGREFKPALHAEVQGNISIVTVGDYSGLLSSGDNQTYPFTIAIPEHANFVSGRMYIYTTWAHDERSRTGEPAVCTLTLNGRPIPVTTTYLDRKGTGTFDYPAETLVCTLSGDQIRDGKNELIISNSGGGNHAFAAYGAVLVMVWDEPEGPRYYYWIGEGSDIVLTDPEFGITADEAASTFVFPGIETSTGVQEARLVVISTAASGEEEDQNRILFNDAEWFNALSAGSSGISRADIDVREFISSRENRVVVQSYAAEGKGDYLENRNAILLIRMSPGSGTGADGLRISAPATGSPKETPKVSTAPNGSSPPQRGHEEAIHPGFIGSLLLWFDALFGGIPGSLLGMQDGQDEHTSLGGLVENETTAIPVEGRVYPLERYTLQVTTDPAGAALTLDGCLYQERSPVTINEVPAGDHQLLLEMEGCAPESRSITIDDNAEIFVTFSLPDNGYGSASDSEEDSGLGGLYVESYPSGGEIIIDGSSTGLLTPHVVYGMREGSHTIKVTYDREGAEEYTARAWVYAGALSRAELNDENHAPRSIEITSDPYKGAYFTVDGTYPRYRIPATIDVRAWQGFVTLSWNGSYLSIPVPVTVTDGETFLIRPEELPLVTLSVDSDPQGARIFIDGFPGPATPALVRNVSAGRHRIALALDDHIPVEKEILVIDLPDQEIDASLKGVLVPYVSGAVALNSTPLGARVYINNRNTGLTTPVVIDHLPIGKIPLKLRYEKSVREPDIVVLPGKTVSYHAQFT